MFDIHAQHNKCFPETTAGLEIVAFATCNANQHLKCLTSVLAEEGGPISLQGSLTSTFSNEAVRDPRLQLCL